MSRTLIWNTKARKNGARKLGAVSERLRGGAGIFRRFPAEKVYPTLDNIRLVPHKPHVMLPLHKTGKTGKTLNIGFVGAMDYKKGLQVVQRLAAEIKKQKCDIRLCLIGYTGDEGENKIFKETGKYRREQLPRLVLENDIDLFFIPAVWPETFLRRRRSWR